MEEQKNPGIETEELEKAWKELEAITITTTTSPSEDYIMVDSIPEQAWTNPMPQFTPADVDLSELVNEVTTSPGPKKKMLGYAKINVKNLKSTQNKPAVVKMLKANNMHKDWFCMVGDPYHLQIDLDQPCYQEPQLRKLLEFMEQAVKIRGWRKTPSKSGNMHYIIELAEPLSTYERILLQACLGSDPKRELLSYFGSVVGNKDAVLLIEKRSEWPGLEEELDPYVAAKPVKNSYTLAGGGAIPTAAATLSVKLPKVKKKQTFAEQMPQAEGPKASSVDGLE